MDRHPDRWLSSHWHWFFKKSRMYWLVGLICLAALLLGGCGRSRAASPATPGAGGSSLAVAAMTTTPTPSPLPPTATPTATPLIPPFPTPEVDLTDRSIYRATLKPAFADDVDAVPGASHYFIRAELKPGQVPTISGIERVRYTNTESVALAALYFRLYPNLSGYNGSATVEQVILNNKLVTPILEAEESALRLPLAEPLQPGQIADMTLWFTATLPTNVVAGTAGSGLYGYVDGVYDLAGFYPTIPVYDDEGWNLDVTVTYGDATYTDTAFHQVELTVPADQTVVASGTTSDRRDNGDGTHTWTIRSGPSRVFYAAASNRYAFISEEVNETQVNSYYQGGGLSGAQTALSYAAGALRQFNRLFGPYPYTELDVVAMPTTAFGMEYPGVVALAQSFYGEGGGAYSIATVHEVAHQWWYNLVGNDQPDEPWLDESLANYSVYLYYEAVNWPEMEQAVMNNIFLYRYHAAQNLGIDRPVAGPVSSFDPSNYVNIVYSKGALFFHAVRERIGDDAFFASLRTYLERYRYKNAYPDDLIAVFEEVSGQSIDDLYEFWITGPPTP